MCAQQKCHHGPAETQRSSAWLTSGLHVVGSWKPSTETNRQFFTPLASLGTGTEGDPAAALLSTLGQSWVFQGQNCLQMFYFPSAWCCHCWFSDDFSWKALTTLKNQAQSSYLISDTVGEEVCCSLFPSPVSALTFFSFLLELYPLVMTLGIFFLN